MFLLDGSKQSLGRLSLLTKDMISKIDGHVLLYQAFYHRLSVVVEIQWHTKESSHRFDCSKVTRTKC